MSRRFIINSVATIFTFACAVHYLSEYVGKIVVCEGSSMEPTLFNNDVLLVEGLTVKLDKLKRGDIVLSRSPTNPQEHICKRLSGLPGDTVQHGIVVPDGHVWLEGDNRFDSIDSRMYGPVPHNLLEGRALCKLLPLNDITLFRTK